MIVVAAGFAVITSTRARRRAGYPRPTGGDSTDNGDAAWSDDSSDSGSSDGGGSDGGGSDGGGSDGGGGD